VGRSGADEEEESGVDRALSELRARDRHTAPLVHSLRVRAWECVHTIHSAHWREHVRGALPWLDAGGGAGGGGETAMV
jgi:hypothetical protein